MASSQTITSFIAGAALLTTVSSVCVRAAEANSEAKLDDAISQAVDPSVKIEIAPFGRYEGALYSFTSLRPINHPAGSYVSNVTGTATVKTCSSQTTACEGQLDKVQKEYLGTEVEVQITETDVPGGVQPTQTIKGWCPGVVTSAGKSYPGGEYIAPYTSNSSGDIPGTIQYLTCYNGSSGYTALNPTGAGLGSTMVSGSPYTYTQKWSTAMNSSGVMTASSISYTIGVNTTKFPTWKGAGGGLKAFVPSFTALPYGSSLETPFGIQYYVPAP